MFAGFGPLVGPVREVELAGGAGQDIDVELLQPRFGAEPQAVPAALPRNNVVVLIRVIDELVGAVTGQVGPVPDS